jgi:hypothetical protein
MPAVTPERQQIERLVGGEHHEPHRLLGAHLDGDRVRIRAWRPDATGVVALIGDDRVTLTKIHPAGLLEVVLPGSDVPAYRLEVAYGDRSFTIDDPYRFWPTIGEIDEHLVGEATHERLWQKLGAHERTLDGVAGTSFAVWAPNARAVEWRRRADRAGGRQPVCVRLRYVLGPGGVGHAGREVPKPDPSRRTGRSCGRAVDRQLADFHDLPCPQRHRARPGLRHLHRRGHPVVLLRRPVCVQTKGKELEEMRV